VPEELKTPELCLIAVQADGRALERVPEKLKTAELCMIAILNGGPAFASVSELAAMARPPNEPAPSPANGASTK
jgi:hypothetical protein